MIIWYNIVGDINDYYSISIQNLSTGDSASGDSIIRADNDGVGLIGHYVNFGISNSNYSPTAVGNIETVSVNAVGSGYTVGDKLTLTGGDENGRGNGL